MSKGPNYIMHKCVVLLMVCLVAMAGEVLAADSPSRLYVKSGRLTGHLTQVPLREVLAHLHKHLGIEYVAPAGELNKVVSATLHKEPVASALSKILAPWDYAFIFDKAGNIKTLYLTAKVPNETPLRDPHEKGTKAVAVKNQPISDSAEDHELTHGSKGLEANLSKRKVPQTGSLTGESTQPNTRASASLGYSMEILPPPPGTTMLVLPPNQQEMPIIPGGSARSMEIVPAANYSTMDIRPVPEQARREMLLNLGS